MKGIVVLHISLLRPHPKVADFAHASRKATSVSPNSGDISVGVNVGEGRDNRFDAEFRRFSINPAALKQFNEFYASLEQLHHLQGIPFVVQYVDPKNSDLLPINNDNNYAVALSASKRLLRILLQRKGESYGELYGYKSTKSTRPHKSAASVLRSYASVDKPKDPARAILMKNDFHLVSSILDVDIVPRELRRVRLVRTPNKQFGLYIRSGVSHHHTINGYEAVPAFFVSRLDRDGVAYGTGLLAEDDEIIEVNGIEVAGKTMDQVTDMMVANSSNLIITVRPADQRTCLPPNYRSTVSSISGRRSEHIIEDSSPISTRRAGSGDSRPAVPSERSRKYSPAEEEETDYDAMGGLITL
ncbi:PDZ/DHR/GLGF domain protein [Opisthorchis viverrini]|uniref:PDZ/DHR/GLGF domain protein n=1 Tax=Opisthorchis viverrini TaxID=6198 RepID=A0A1S8WGM0_OPIVI|nr:PDZ/DHR/GLGF domain protein [Opisthorchis viverrini]